MTHRPITARHVLAWLCPLALWVSRAEAGFVVVRNAKNPTAKLTRDAVKGVFSGRTKTWSSGDTIILVIGTEDSPAMQWLAELILAGHLAYVSDDIHLVSELAWIRHRENGTDVLHHTTAFLAELGYHLGDYTPYLRYEDNRFDNADSYFESAGIVSADSQRVSAGGKYLASASMAFKLQTSVTAGDIATHYTTIGQVAFAF